MIRASTFGSNARLWTAYKMSYSCATRLAIRLRAIAIIRILRPVFGRIRKRRCAMTKPHAITLDFTCFCLLKIVAGSHVRATVYYRLKKAKVYKPFASERFLSSGPAIEWARSIEPSIECIKVADHESK